MRARITEALGDGGFGGDEIDESRKGHRDSLLCAAVRVQTARLSTSSREFWKDPGILEGPGNSGRTREFWKDPEMVDENGPGGALQPAGAAVPQRIIASVDDPGLTQEPKRRTGQLTHHEVTITSRPTHC
ncbi:hypothetical protein GCM10011575_43610 [Microlunatus endophyticus]|uniref:Uncharacterized protein n=1 Tax=Microlunatus endophyticus TaxID=1716077 RepID=A0A917SHQ5_9ACTN|nr:hypothetical protein GCM10011575_43610 [Microlunatus endophyticus]